MSERTYDVPDITPEWHPQLPEDAGPARARGDAADVIQRAERVAKEADNLRAFLIDHARHVSAELDQKAIDAVVGAVAASLDTVATIGAEVIATLRSQPVNNPAPPPKSMQDEATGQQQPVLHGIADRAYDFDEKSEELLMFVQDHFSVLLGLSLAQLGDFCEETGAQLEMVRRNCGEVQKIVGDALKQVRRNELHSR